MKEVQRFAIVFGWVIALVLLSGASLHAQQTEPAGEMKAFWAADGRPLWALPRQAPADASAAVIVATPDQPEMAPDSMFDWTSIAFDSGRDGNWEVYTARGDGSQAQRITNHPAADVQPQLNRGATTVFFASNREGGQFDIFSASASGGNVQRLTGSWTDDRDPALSPTGALIAYACRRDDNWEICRVQANGGGEVRLTYSPNYDDLMPSWSPDGQRIVWVREQNGNGALWTMAADGSGAQLLLGGAGYRYLQNPHWSPGGRYIAFDADVDRDYWNEVVVYDTLYGISNTVYDPGQPLTDAWASSWSPDGQYLSFNVVQYVVVGNQLYMGASVMARWYFTLSQLTAFPGSGLDVINDWETADGASPVTRVSALPGYSRAAGFEVTWTGSDVGPAGIASFDVQRRVGSGSWTDWLPGVTQNSALWTGAPGETVSFRVRGRDHAGNVEDWPASPNGDASTTLFSWVLGGRVLDSRGVPLARADVVVSPAPVAPARSNVRGNYQTLLLADGAHTLSASLAGHGPAPASVFQISSDRAIDVSLPPLDDRVQNGGFEAAGQPLAGWQTSGAVGSSQPGQWGARAAALGEACPAPCLTDPVSIWSGGILGYADVAVDSQGNFHIVFQGWDSAAGYPAVYHTARLRNGDMLPATLVGRAGDYHSNLSPKLAIAANDVLHVVWAGAQGLYFSTKAPNGNWSAAQVIGPGRQPDIAVDSQGRDHLIYECYGACGATSRIFYRQRSTSGLWQAPVAMDSGNGYMLPGITVGPDDAAHLIWQEVGGGIFARTRHADGSWSARQTVYTMSGYSYDPQVILADPSGGVHALWNSPYQVYYANRQPGGGWSAAQALLPMRYSFRAAVDSQGRIHVLGMLMYAPNSGLYYTIREPAGAWSTPLLIADGQWEIAFGADGIAQMMGYDMTGNGVTLYRTALRRAGPAVSSLAQTMTIPAAMHKPTLGFWYRIDGATADSQSQMVVTLSAGGSTTQVFTATHAPEWSQQSLDLTAWRGQTVTLSFELQQAAGDFYQTLLVDNVTVGSWLTPVPAAVQPEAASSGVASRLTIRGENFLPGAAVRINTTSLAGVAWIDEQTLEADLPAGFAPGLYNLWVSNPGGQMGVLPSGLRVGHSAWLPLVATNSRP